MHGGAPYLRAYLIIRLWELNLDNFIYYMSLTYYLSKRI